MKKIAIILTILLSAHFAQAQFPTNDSAQKFTNKWIRNSAVDAFTNLRLNTVLIYALRQIDSTQILSFAAVNDSTIRLITKSKDTFTVVVRGVGGGGSGTVGSGTQYQLAYYNANGTAVAGLTSITGNRAIISDANGLPIASTTTATEIGFLDGVTSGIQSQLDGKQATGNYITATTGDVAATGPGSVAATIQPNAVSYGKIQQASGLSVIGRSANSSGNVGEITAASDGQAVVRNGSALEFGAVNLAKPSAITGELPNANIASFSNWPAEQPFGEIYKKTLWSTNAADWSVSGTARISFVSGVPTITATSVNWSNLVSVIPDRLTMLNQWDDSVDVQLTFTPSAGTTGFGPAIISVNGNITTSYKCYLNTSNSGNGNLILADNNGTTVASASGVTNTLNDVIRFWFKLNDSTISIAAKNLTTGGAYATASYNIPTTNLAGRFIPNTAKWGFVVHGTGTYKVLAVNISSTATRYANVAFITDSKGISVGAASVGSSWTRTLGNSFPTAVFLCDGGGTLANLISRRDEVFALNPQTAILAMGCNDKRYGASDNTVIERMQTVDGWLRGKGIRTFWTIFPEDSTGGSPGVGLTAIKNWMASNFGSRYIDMWTTMATNNILESAYQADKTHFNQEGSRIADSIIRAGNYLITLDPQRRSAFRTYNADITPIGGDSLAFAYKQERRANYINKTNDSLNIVPSLVTDNGTSVAISLNHSTIPTPFSGTLLHVNGIATTSGTNGAFIRMDRTNTSNSFANYSNNNVDRFAYNGTDITYLNSDGSLLLGNQASTGAFLSTFRIKHNKNLNAAQNGVALFFNSDTATATWTAATAAGNVFMNTFKSQLLTGSNGSPTYDTLGGVLIEKPRVGGTLTGNRIYSLMVRGRMMINEADSVTSPTGGYLFKDFATGEIKLTGGATEAGDVTGPASSTDNAIARYDGTTGKIIQNSVVTIDDNGDLLSSGSLSAGSEEVFSWSGKSWMRSWDDGNITFTNSFGDDFNMLQFGGFTSGYPAWQRTGTTLTARLADNSANTRVAGADAVNPTEFVTLQQLNAGVKDSTGYYTITGTTTDATPTILTTIVLPTASMTSIESTVVAIKNDGNGGYTSIKTGTYLKDAVPALSSGGATIVADTHAGTLSTATMTMTNSGTNAAIQVTGEAATTIQWKIRYKILQTNINL